MSSESPCVGQCRADSNKARCAGCGRTLAEIGRWSRMDDAEKQAVINRIEHEKRPVKK